MFKDIVQINEANRAVYLNALFLLFLLLVGVADAFAIVIAYFFETIVIGLIHVVKLYLTVRYGRPSSPQSKGMDGYGIIPFFMVHYGLFVGVQSIFVITFFAPSMFEDVSPSNIVENYGDTLLTSGMLVVLASIIFTNLAYFYTNFLNPKRYEAYAPDEIFMKPYLRIFIQQFVVILAGFFFIILDAGMAAALFLVLIRTFVDLVIVGIRKDSTLVGVLAHKLARSHEEVPKIEKTLQQLSE